MDDQNAVSNAVCAALDSVKTNGTFASFSEIRLQHLPPVSVKDVGNIQYPLTEDDARKIIDKANQAPFGKGSKTLVDTSVRNTWELNPHLFDANTAAWKRMVDVLLGHVSQVFGIKERIRAEPYKMLLYQAGSFFKEHKDTNDKIPNMFGTMIIALPSDHTGGQVRLKHADQEMWYRSDTYHSSVAFWYSDVDHEVFQVQSGYRWVLSFNLAVDQDIPIPVPRDRLDIGLRDALARWAENVEEEQTHLIYPLEYKYTEANLDLKSMKGHDRERLDNLVGLANQLGFKIFFATIEKAQSGSVFYDHSRYSRRNYWGDWEEDEDDDGGHHDIEEVFDTRYEMKLIKDLHGKMITTKLPLDTDFVAGGEEVFERDVPDEEDYEGYMGNSGPEATHYYRASVVIIVPKQLSTEFLSGGWNCWDAEANGKLVDYLLEEAKSDELAYKDLRKLWTRASTNKNHLSYGRNQLRISVETSATTLLTAFDRYDHAFFTRISEKVSESLPLQFFKQLGDRLGAAGHDALDPVINDVDTLLMKYLTFHERYAAVEALHARDCPEAKVGRLGKSILGRLASLDQKMLTESDGIALADYAAFYLGNAKSLEKDMVPWLKMCITEPVGLAFLRRWLVSFRVANVADGDGVAIFRSLAKLFVDQFEPALMRPEPLNKKPRHTYIYSETTTSEPFFTAGPIGDLILNLIEVGATEELDRFAAVMEDHAMRINDMDLFVLWMPLLGILHSSPRCSAEELAHPRYVRIFEPLITALIKNFLGPRPQAESLSRRPVPCNCRDCLCLNRFLTDPGMDQDHFPMGKARRQHLHQVLDRAGIDCTHETLRRGNPQPLIVRKTNTKHAKRVEAWETKHALLSRQISCMKDTLRVVLGNRWEAVTALPGVEASGLTARNQQGQQRVAGTKRKIEFIDLTEED